MADPGSIATIHLNALNLTRQADHAQRTLTASIPSPSGKVDPKLQNACQEMESIFINYLFKEMRTTINRSGFVSGGTAETIFTSMLDTEMSKGIAVQGGIGLSRILMDQLSGGSENQEGDLQLEIDQAHLIIGNIYKSAAVKSDMRQVDFTVSLKAGTTFGPKRIALFRVLRGLSELSGEPRPSEKLVAWICRRH